MEIIELVLFAVGLGVGLAMDAFSVSLANGINEPKMKKAKMCGISSIFAGFQILMPLIGYFCVHTILEYFESFQIVIPYIALILLSFIGGKMLIEGIRSKNNESMAKPAVGILNLIIQGVATSIDALSVGTTIGNYKLWEALIATSIIGVVTFIICFLGIIIGKKFGTAMAKNASILGGIILISIGIIIFIKSFI